MSSLVALGCPLATPGTAGGSGQPARLYVKGAAELLLDSCRLQVGLDGTLLPLPPAQVAALKQQCGKGGLRMLALAYKDLLLSPAAEQADAGVAPSAEATGHSWQLLENDDDQSDLVLIALLGLEDPGGWGGAGQAVGSEGDGLGGWAGGTTSGAEQCRSDQLRLTRLAGGPAPT